MTALPVIPALLLVAWLLWMFSRMIEASRIRPPTPYELQLARMAEQFNALGIAIGRALAPSLKQACESMAALGRAFAASGLTPERIEIELRRQAGARNWKDL